MAKWWYTIPKPRCLCKLITFAEFIGNCNANKWSCPVFFVKTISFFCYFVFQNKRCSYRCQERDYLWQRYWKSYMYLVRFCQGDWLCVFRHCTMSLIIGLWVKIQHSKTLNIPGILYCRVKALVSYYLLKVVSGRLLMMFCIILYCIILYYIILYYIILYYIILYYIILYCIIYYIMLH